MKNSVLFLQGYFLKFYSYWVYCYVLSSKSCYEILNIIKVELPNLIHNTINIRTIRSNNYPVGNGEPKINFSFKE